MSKSIVMGKGEAGSVHIDVGRLLKTRALVTANSGGGKSWLLRLMFEGLGATTQLLVLDREGEFVTLREKLDVLIVGPEGEIPADVRSAPLLVRRLMEKEISAVIDMSEMKIDGQREYVKSFLDAMIELPKTLWHPCFVGLDETHLFAPEKGDAKSADAVIGLATLGRKRGYCAIYATQRISKLHKDAAAELLNKFIGRTTLDIDQERAADELGMSRKDARPILREMSPIGGEGEFFGFGPALSIPGIVRMRAGKVHTTHPEAGGGQALTPPKPSSAIRAALAEFTDLPKQAAEEIRNLEQAQTRIRELERGLKSAPVAKPVEVSSKADKAAISQLRKGLAEAMKLIKEIETREAPAGVDVAKVQAILSAAGEQIVREFQRSSGEQQAEFGRMKSKASELANRLATLLDGEFVTPTRVDFPASQTTARVAKNHASDTAGRASLNPIERDVLDAAASFPNGATRQRISIFSGRSIKSSSFNGVFSDGVAFDGKRPSLVQAGLLRLDGERYVVTDEGASLAEPRAGVSLDDWLKKLTPSEAKVLATIADLYPNRLTREQVSEKSGQSIASSSFQGAFRPLRELGLIEGTSDFAATESLMNP